MPTTKAEGVRVRQSANVDWTKLPVDDQHIPLLITGGEALEICEHGWEERAQLIDKRKKLLAKVRKAVTPPRGTMPRGTKIELHGYTPNFINVALDFKDCSILEEANVKDAYLTFAQDSSALKVNKNPWVNIAPLGKVYCKVAFNIREEQGRKLKKMVEKTLKPIPNTRSLAEKILADENGRYDFVHWVVRARSPATPPGIRLSQPGVYQEGDLWFLGLPVKADSPPSQIYLPRGTFKRLKMSQYWDLLEKEALRETSDE